MLAQATSAKQKEGLQSSEHVFFLHKNMPFIFPANLHQLLLIKNFSRFHIHTPLASHKHTQHPNPLHPTTYTFTQSLPHNELLSDGHKC